jgi:sulfite exporter TauE/SafE/copper chaperone CopZ
MRKITEEKLNIDGMSCHSCEKVLKSSIKNLDGITKVSASFNDKTVTVKYDEQKVSRDDIIAVIEKEGYTLKNNSSNNFVIISIIAILILYLALKDTNIFNFIPEVDQSMNYGILFVVGLLTSLHCIAMCGGINMSVSINHQLKNKDKSKKNTIIPGMLYNLGRVTSYTIIGGIVGLIGSVISFSPDAKNLVSVVVGLFMIGLGINMTGIIKNKKLFNFPIPKFITSFLIKQKRRVSSPYTIGLINGFMPCGPLQSMQVYALGTGSFFYGAISMFFFALGTVPLMIIVSLMSSFLSAKMSVTLKKISAVFIIFLGLIMLNRGIDFNTLIPKNEPTIPKSAITAEIKDGYQEVTTRFYRGQYVPIVVQKGIPVRWTIVINGGDLNGCNNKIYIAKYNLTVPLDFGENIVEFTPDESGAFRYTCWMNMLRSTIYVVDSLEINNE